MLIAFVIAQSIITPVTRPIVPQAAAPEASCIQLGDECVERTPLQKWGDDLELEASDSLTPDELCSEDLCYDISEPITLDDKTLETQEKVHPLQFQ